MYTDIKEISYVNELRNSILSGEFDLLSESLDITGASYIYQTTQFPKSQTKYHNYYLLIRVGSYFGSCSHTPEQLELKIAEELSGIKLDDALSDERLPVKIAAMDAYFGVAFPHEKNCNKVINIPAGSPVEKANARDMLIAEIANIKPSQNIALIGVVNPLVAAIEEKGGICLPCDLQLEKTQWGEIVEKDMEVVLKKADSVICTGMTLSNGTFDRILQIVRERNIPLTMYAQTGSAIIARFLGKGVTGLVAEPFPFTQFSAYDSPVFCYVTEEQSNKILLKSIIEK